MGIRIESHPQDTMRHEAIYRSHHAVPILSMLSIVEIPVAEIVVRATRRRCQRRSSGEKSPTLLHSSMIT